MRYSRSCRLAAVCVFAFALGSCLHGQSLSPGDDVYPKRNAIPVYASDSSDSEPIGKLQFGTSYEVVAVNGRWVALKVGGKQAWIYSGNVSRDKPPEQNTSAVGTSKGEVSTAAAARGLDPFAKEYAGRHGYGSAVAQVEWVERFNAGISSGDVRAYMKSNRLGEYSAK
jgi:hypothetical protein